MTRRKVNPQLIKLHRTYSVEEVSRTLAVHKNTVRSWKVKGLTPIDDSQPMLFRGDTLRAFLKAQLHSRKQPCPPGTIYCLKCRAPRPPVLEVVEYHPTNAISGTLKAPCISCGTMMNRSVRLADLEVVMPGTAVQFTTGVGRIS